MRVLVLGGTSEIGLAIAKKLRPDQLVLAVRAESKNLAPVKAELAKAGVEAEIIDFDAGLPQTHPQTIAEAFRAPVDLAIVAFGVLGDENTWQHHAETVEMAQINYVGALSVGVLLAERMRAQGYGKIVALSSVAGMRVRRSNFVYGSTKAGMDGFYLQLGEAVRADGVEVLVVRPGVVATKMVATRKSKPLTVRPETVANRVVKALKTGKRVIHVPRIFRLIMAIYRRLPAWLVRKINF